MQGRFLYPHFVYFSVYKSPFSFSIFLKFSVLSCLRFPFYQKGP